MTKKKMFKNILSGFGGQFIAIVLGLVVPRLFITSYGSDVNGLLSTIAQIFTYLALLESGIGQAARNLLYKPFQEKDKEQIIEVSSIAKAYFRRCTLIYGLGVIVLSILLPAVLKTQINNRTVTLIVLLEGMSGVISFWFIQVPTIILGVDGRNYVNNNISLINKIVSCVVKIVMASLKCNILLLEVAYFSITLTKVLFYKLYFKNNYQWLYYKRTNNRIKLKDRNSYIITEICWTVFSSTDMIILSTFVSTQLSSVYGIYNMIFSNISILLNAVYTSIVYLLGQTFHEDKAKYAIIHDMFNSVFIGLITSLMIVCYFLTIPFVELYTRGVNDISYVYTYLPIMFCLVQLMSWSRYISGNLIGLAGRIRKAVWVNVLEALINLSFSIIGVLKFGIVGVLFATVIALPVKLIYCNYVGDKIILGRSCKNTVKILGINFTLFFLAVFICHFVTLSVGAYTEFVLYGLGLLGITLTIVMFINAVANPYLMNYAFGRLRKDGR